MKIGKYLKKHPDLPPAVQQVLREAAAFAKSETGDDPSGLIVAVSDMLAGKEKKQAPVPPMVAAATSATFSSVYQGYPPLRHPPGMR